MCHNSLNQSPIWRVGLFCFHRCHNNTQLPCSTAVHTCPCFTGCIPGNGSVSMWSVKVLIFIAVVLCLPDILPVSHPAIYSINFLPCCTWPSPFLAFAWLPMASHTVLPHAANNAATLAPFTFIPLEHVQLVLSQLESLLVPWHWHTPPLPLLSGWSPWEPPVPFHPTTSHNLSFIYLCVHMSAISVSHWMSVVWDMRPHVFYFPPCPQHLSQWCWINAGWFCWIS